MAKRFEGKNVFILGGSGGIGLATAQDFLAEGARVAVTGRDPDKLKAAEKAHGVLTFRADVRDLVQTRGAVEQAAEALGHFDILFVNAGAASVGRVSKITPEAWDQCYAENLRGCVFTIQYALPYLRDGGAIIVSGSVAGVETTPTVLAYSTAKAALHAASRLIAADLLPRKIRVNTVVIGPTKTNLYTRGADPAKVAEREALFAKDIPMGRMGDVAEISRAVLFLASDEASFVTGSELVVDGGHLNLRNG
jgi:NAD(P)-dependent dehydrogenase (short-subunit alcohol dehydrogenase family)